MGVILQQWLILSPPVHCYLSPSIEASYLLLLRSEIEIRSPNIFENLFYYFVLVKLNKLFSPTSLVAFRVPQKKTTIPFSCFLTKILINLKRSFILKF